MNEIIKTKICIKCKLEKELSEYYFRKDTNSYRNECKECRRKWDREHSKKETVKERKRKQLKEYNKTEKGVQKRRECQKRHNKTEARIEYQKQYRKTEKMKEYLKEYRKRYSFEYRKTEKMKEYKKNYNEANRIKIKEYQAKYRKSQIGKIARINSNTKRRNCFTSGDVTTEQLLELRQNAKTCYWCNCSLKKVKVNIDHYLPLSKGGLHTLDNLIISCQRCNNQKHAKDPIEFANSLGKLL